MDAHQGLPHPGSNLEVGFHDSRLATWLANPNPNPNPHQACPTPEMLAAAAAAAAKTEDKGKAGKKKGK